MNVAAPTACEGEVIAVAPRQQRVLLVDNDAAQRFRCAAALRHVGIEVIEAQDADEGYAKARSEQPDRIICGPAFAAAPALAIKAPD